MPRPKIGQGRVVKCQALKTDKTRRNSVYSGFSKLRIARCAASIYNPQLQGFDVEYRPKHRQELKMKLPPEIDRITLVNTIEPTGPYPPLGFIPFAEWALGNGDQFGLFWPFGREADPPIVCEMYHDEWSLQPCYSSLKAFLDNASDKDDHEDESSHTYLSYPGLDQDSRSPYADYEAARSCLKDQRVSEAIEHLEAAISILPEYTEALCLLCTQYRRAGRSDDAISTAIGALISPPSFGRSTHPALRILRSHAEPPDHLTDDPIWNRKDRLTMRFGGMKENEDYDVLREAIAQYQQMGRDREAIVLFQTYCEHLNGETVSFQERYGFDAKQSLDRLKDLCEQRLGDRRVLV